MSAPLPLRCLYCEVGHLEVLEEFGLVEGFGCSRAECGARWNVKEATFAPPSHYEELTRRLNEALALDRRAQLIAMLGLDVSIRVIPAERTDQTRVSLVISKGAQAVVDNFYLHTALADPAVSAAIIKQCLGFLTGWYRSRLGQHIEIISRPAGDNAGAVVE